MTPQHFSSLKERAAIFRNDNAATRAVRLEALLSWIEKHEEEIIEALRFDFNKPRFETQLSEIYPCLSEIKYTLKNLKRWMKDTCVSTPMVLFGHRSSIRHENKGTVLIISPWNYPFQLAVVPMISALAAGNTVVIKPSELTPHTSEVIKKMAEQCFYSNEVCVELGPKEKTQELLSYNFDHVFFTGSTPVGRVIASACAERLIPVTLELGGKSPTIVDETADLTDAAEKIFWGKFLNRGQTCIAPDYLVIHESIETELMSKIKSLASRQNSGEKARIINDRNHQRLQKMMDIAVDLNRETLVTMKVSSAQHASMREEIFGPLLPYFTYRNPEDLKRLIVTEEKPLSLYVFSENQKMIDYVLNTFPSGSVGINAVAVQFANHYLPFGGTGASGAGAYHGYYGFREFSHARAVIRHNFLTRTRRLLMPPYNDFKLRAIALIKKHF